MAEVSIIIPCYNYGRYLPEAIESALEQTCPVEVIVVDDGSTDNTFEVASCYPVTLIRTPDNWGIPAARNAGIRVARGSHILPMDADDIMLPLCVESMVHAGLDGIVRCQLQEFGHSHRILGTSQAPTLANQVKLNNICATALFPKEAWERIGGYDESLTRGGEDWDFWVRMLAAGYPAYSVEQPLYRYRIHGDSGVIVGNDRHDEMTRELRAKWRAMGIEGA